MSFIKTLSLDGLKKNVKYKHPALSKTIPVFTHGDTVKGRVSIDPGSKPLSHKGILIILKGIYQTSDGQVLEIFFTRTLQILPPGSLSQAIEPQFTFGRVTVPFPTYLGKLMNIKYFVECKIELSDPVVSRAPLYFVKLSEITETPLNKPIGIDQVMHIEVLLNSVVIDCRKEIIGALFMSLAKIRMIHMSIEIYRRETLKYPTGDVSYEEKVGEWEVMDGAPVRGTLIPIRVFLAKCNCWPAPRANGCKVDVEYAMKLRGCDEKNSTYAKRIPIELLYEK